MVSTLNSSIWVEARDDPDDLLSVAVKDVRAALAPDVIERTDLLIALRIVENAGVAAVVADNVLKGPRPLMPVGKNTAA